MNNYNLQIGDLVEVIRIGGVYDLYLGMVDFFKMKNWVAYRLPDINHIFRIINIHGHLSFFDDVVAYIKDVNNGREFIVNIDSLKLYERYEFFSKEEFMIE